MIIFEFKSINNFSDTKNLYYILYDIKNRIIFLSLPQKLYQKGLLFVFFVSEASENQQFNKIHEYFLKQKLNPKG